MSVAMLESWLDLRELADQLACSTRKIEYLLAKWRDSQDPFPSAMILGRRKFRQSEVEAWLERHGEMRKEGAA